MQTAGFTTTPAIARVLANQLQILAMLGEIHRRLGIVMSEDSIIAAQAAELESDAQATNTALAAIQAAFGTLEAEVQAGQAAVSPATMAALQQAVADVHAAAGAGTADASVDAAAAAGTKPAGTAVPGA